MLTIVTGPPCAGKTTYVAQHAQPGDIIIDFDAMARALGAHDRNYSNPVRAVTQYARGAAIKGAISWHRRGARVWITECQPSPQRWRQYALAGARHVKLDVDPDELHRRIDAERPASYHALADQMLNRQPAVTSRSWLPSATRVGSHNP
jgi:hypothetical protein